MLRQRIRQLFEKHDAVIQQIVLDVTTLEQENISFQRPRIREELDEIITRIAKQELQRLQSIE